MKNINNAAYQAYNNLITGYDKGDLSRGFDHESNTLFVRGAISLASQKLENPFPSGSVEAHLLFKMHYCYGLWRRGGIDHKVNRRRMLMAASELAAMHIENPYDFEIDPVIEPSEAMVSLDAIAEAEIDTAQAEDLASGTYVPAVNIQKIFGVLPVKEAE